MAMPTSRYMSSIGGASKRHRKVTVMPYEQMKEDVSPSDPQPPTHPSMVNVHTVPGINQGNATAVTVPAQPGAIITPQDGQQMVILTTQTGPITASMARAVVAIAITQLVLGNLSIIFNIAATVTKSFVVYFIGPGFWCGICYILAGSFGIAVSRRGNIGRMVITSLVLSVVSTVITVFLIASASTGIWISNFYACSGITCNEGQQMAILETQTDQIPAGKSRALVVMGIAQLVLGILAILFNIIATIRGADIVSFVGPGYWCGIFYIVSGSFGIAGGRNKTRCMIITSLAFNTVSTVLTVCLVAMASWGVKLVFQTDDPRCVSFIPHCNKEASLDWNVLLLVCGLAEFVISIVSSAICVGVVCKSNNTDVASPMQYLNDYPQVISGHIPQPDIHQMMASNQPMENVQIPNL